MKNTVVIDLNVFVRAILTDGINRIIYEAIKEERITPAFSPDMLEDLAKVLLRPRLKLNPEDVKSFLTILSDKAMIVKPTMTINACRDSSDNIILETAMTSQAKTIITNDFDLLVEVKA